MKRLIWWSDSFLSRWTNKSGRVVKWSPVNSVSGVCRFLENPLSSFDLGGPILQDYQVNSTHCARRARVWQNDVYVCYVMQLRRWTWQDYGMIIRYIHWRLINFGLYFIYKVYISNDLISTWGGEIRGANLPPPTYLAPISHLPQFVTPKLPQFLTSNPTSHNFWPPISHRPHFTNETIFNEEVLRAY